jgi:CRISPR-associated endoribonuclease Cas6
MTQPRMAGRPGRFGRMSFSMLMTGYPTQDIPAGRVQGPALQGMFLHLLESVDPGAAQRLHEDNRYRPYTLSPLGIGDLSRTRPDAPFHGFSLPSRQRVSAGAACSLRITLLEDELFPTFSRYFLTRAAPSFHLGGVEFQVTNVLVTGGDQNPWSRYTPYPELLARGARPAGGRSRIGLRFLSPTSFRIGDVDLSLPLPRLVF